MTTVVASSRQVTLTPEGQMTTFVAPSRPVNTHPRGANDHRRRFVTTGDTRPRRANDHLRRFVTTGTPPRRSEQGSTLCGAMSQQALLPEGVASCGAALRHKATRRPSVTCDL